MRDQPLAEPGVWRTFLALPRRFISIFEVGMDETNQSKRIGWRVCHI
jgi:hypothetical protein